MNNVGQSFVLSLVLGVSLCHAASITYDYTGSDFTSAQFPYTTSDFISGSFTVSSPLGSSLNAADITSQVLSFSFTDGGINTVGSSSGAEDQFVFSTDSQGNITAWSVGLILLGSPISNTIGLFTCDNTAAFEATCSGTAYDLSYEQLGGIEGQNASDPGTWTTTETTSTPEPSTLILLCVGLGLATMLRLAAWPRAETV